MEYIKPNIKIVFYEDLMQTITTSNPKEGDASGGRAKETTYYEEDPEKIETGIPSQYHSIWEDEE